MSNSNLRAAKAAKLQKRDNTKITTYKSDVFLLEARADKLRRYRGPNPPKMVLRPNVKRHGVGKGSGNATEKQIDDIIDGNKQPTAVVKRYEYASVNETACSLATDLELKQLIQDKMVLVENLLVAATKGTEAAINSKAIEDVDKTFAAGSPSLSRLPSYMGVIDRCLHLHKLLCQTKDALDASLSREKKLVEQNRSMPAPAANVFPSDSQRRDAGEAPASARSSGETPESNPANGKVEALESELEKWKSVVKEMKSEHLKELENSSNKGSEAFQKKLKSVVEGYESDTKKIQARLATVEMGSSKKDSEIESLKAANKTLKEDFAIAQKELEIALGKLSKASNGSNDHAQEIQAVKDKLVALEKAGETKDERVKDLELETTTLNVSKASLQKELQLALDSLQAATANRDKLQEELKSYVDDQQSKAEGETKQAEEFMKRIEELNAELVSVREAAAKYDQVDEMVVKLRIEMMDKESKWKQREKELVDAGIATLAREKELETSRDDAVKKANDLLQSHNESVGKLKTKLRAAEAVPARIERMSKDASSRYHEMVGQLQLQISKMKQQSSVDEGTMKSLKEEASILRKQIDDISQSRADAAMRASGLSKQEFEDTFEAVMREEFDAMRAAYEKRLEGKRSEIETIKRSCNREVREAIEKSKAGVVRMDMTVRRKEAEIEHLLEQLEECRTGDK